MPHIILEIENKIMKAKNCIDTNILVYMFIFIYYNSFTFFLYLGIQIFAVLGFEFESAVILISMSSKGEFCKL